MKAYLDKCDLELSYWIHGEGKPLLFLHGFMLNHSVMMGFFEPILSSSCWQRYYLDLPGMGSSQATSPASSDSVLEAIVEFIESIPNPITVVGYSYGAYLALGLLNKLKHKIEALYLLCPVTIANKADRSLPQPLSIELSDEYNIIAKKCSEIELEIFNSFAVKSLRCWERFQKEVMATIKKANMKHIDELEKCYELASERVFKKDIADWDGRAMILCGRHDTVVGYRDACQFVDNFSNCSFHVIDRAGHNLPIEQEDIFAMLTSNWFRELGKK